MRYYIIAGEASGDLHGSNLMKGLYAQDPSATVRFWGGPLMDGVYRQHESGEGLVADYRQTAVMGYLEVLLKGNKEINSMRTAEHDNLTLRHRGSTRLHPLKQRGVTDRLVTTDDGYTIRRFFCMLS